MMHIDIEPVLRRLIGNTRFFIDEALGRQDYQELAPIHDDVEMKIRYSSEIWNELAKNDGARCGRRSELGVAIATGLNAIPSS